MLIYQLKQEIMKRIFHYSLFFICFWLLFTLIPLQIIAEGGKKDVKTKEEIDTHPAVEVISFLGKSTNNKKVDLYCKVKSNCCYNIIVERSSNGKRYNSIASFSDNKQLGEFEFPDESPLRYTNYYRLKIADNQGRISYSKTMVVQLYKSKNVEMVCVTPNTSFQDLHINVQLKSRAYISIKITDDKGRDIIKKGSTGNEGINTFELEGTGKMTAGNYTLEVLINSKDLLVLPLIKG